MSDVPYRIERDERHSVIRVSVHGFWAAEDAQLFAADLNRQIEMMRMRHPTVRVLVDRRATPVQGREVVELLGRAATAYRPGDRLALLFDSKLQAMQLQRIIRHAAETKTFTDMGEAESWLLGDETGAAP